MAIKQNDETSVIFYKSFQDMINRIRDGKVRALAYDAIFEYAFFGREPKTDNDLVWMVFLAAKPQIDANSKRRENGKKGGRKAAGAAAQAEKADAAEAAWQKTPAQPEKTALICLETSGKQKQKNRKPNVNDNGNGNGNDNENENGNGNENGNENVNENGNQNGNATAADHHHHPDHSRISLTADDKTEQPPGGDSGAEPRGAGGDAGRSGEPQTIFCYSREQFPTNQCELQKFRAYTEELFQRYHKSASEEDVENVFLRTYRRMELADGAIAAFDAERAELLSYAFEQAAAADKLNWRYINGMYRNFDQRDITTVSDALQYELERSRRFG